MTIAMVQTGVLPLRGSPVRAIDVGHAYRDRDVLRGVYLELRAGEIYGLLGPNGAGKTTLMKAMCGRIRPSSGMSYQSETNFLPWRPISFTRCDS